MTLRVDVQLATDDASLPTQRQLIEWARAAWRGGSDDAEVVVRAVDEAEGRRLNHEFRGSDRATNVLSFPFQPPPGVELDHLGDLVICAPVVAREALQQGKPAQAHWAHMVVHGMLHLQGYDHETDEQAVEMEGRETQILTALGFAAPYAGEQGPAETQSDGV
jgi:probable rRNA maturation factor